MADTSRFVLAPRDQAQLEEGASDAPTLLNWADNPSPGTFNPVLGLIAKILASSASTGDPSVSQLAMPGGPGKAPGLRSLVARDPNMPGPVLEPLKGIQSIRNGQVVSQGVHGLTGALRELGIQPPPRLSQNYGIRPGTVRLGEVSSRRSGEGRVGYGTTLYKDEVETLLDLTRQRYIELARQLHPDAPGGGNPEEMKKLNVLYDYAKKGLLDRRMTAPVRPESGPPLTGTRPIGGGSGLSEEDLAYRQAWQKAYQNYQSTGKPALPVFSEGEMSDMSGLAMPLGGAYTNLAPPRKPPAQPGTPEWSMLDEIEKLISDMHRGKRFPDSKTELMPIKDFINQALNSRADDSGGPAKIGGNRITESSLVEAYLKRYIEMLLGSKAPKQSPFIRSELDDRANGLIPQ